MSDDDDGKTRTRTIDGISSYDDCSDVCLLYSPYAVLENIDYETGSSSSSSHWWDVPIEYSSDVGCTCLLNGAPSGVGGMEVVVVVVVVVVSGTGSQWK